MTLLRRRIGTLAAALLMLLGGGLAVTQQAHAASSGSCNGNYRLVRTLPMYSGNAVGGYLSIYANPGTKRCMIARPAAGRPSYMSVGAYMYKWGQLHTAWDDGPYHSYAGPIYLDLAGANEWGVSAGAQIGNSWYYIGVPNP